MLKIQKLFEVTVNDDTELDYLSLEHVPKMKPPIPGKDKFKKDLEAVIFYHNNPVLKSGFLDTSHRSVKDVFKTYCHESGYKIDWKSLKPVLKDLKQINKKLKNTHKRPRPKHNLIHLSDRYGNIHDMNSFSFPSGHTSEAYFIANVISAAIPEARADLENIAMLIGQSRIENAVHYPTDVTYGRIVGEVCARYFCDSLRYDKTKIKKKRKAKHNKAFAEYLKSGEMLPKEKATSIANFIFLTLQIEDLHRGVRFSDCFKAGKNLLTSIPDKYLSDIPSIASQCRALRESFYLKDYTPEGCIRIHKQLAQSDLERGSPGEIRSYRHYSPAGVSYCSPDKIFSNLSKLSHCDDPILRHALYEWVHPFCDGNGRSGRIILCADLDYDFEKVNRIIGKDYIENLNMFYSKNNIEKYFT